MTKPRNVANEDRLAWSIAQNFVITHVPTLNDAHLSTIKFRARLAELIADLRAGMFFPNSPQTLFPDVAKKVLLHIIEYIEDVQECPLCDLGEDPSDDAATTHGCPLQGFEATTALMLLKKWAESNEVATPPLSLADRGLELRRQLEAFELDCAKAGYHDVGKHVLGARIRLGEGVATLADAVEK